MMGSIKGPFEMDHEGSVQWLETNQEGAFSCGTSLDCPESKYHGLLITPIKGAEGRFHILSAVDAVIRGSDGLSLGTNRYPGTIFPESFKNLERVDLLPWPSWIYRREGMTVRKEVFMRPGQKAVYIAFTLEEGPSAAVLDLKFLFTCRGSHNLTRGNPDINPEIRGGASLRIKPYDGLPEAEVTFSGEWKQSGNLYWDHDIEYPLERERGLEYSEDRFVPGLVEISLNKGRAFIIRLAVEDELSLSPSELVMAREQEMEARRGAAEAVISPEALLRYKSRDFLLTNPSGRKSVNAGYPWFGEWGRDTMIALPGLSCYNGNTAFCVDVLCDYISMMKNGLLPNTLGATQGYTSYNSIDAGLLFCRAVINLMKSGYGGLDDEKTILKEKFLPAVSGLIDAFIEGRVPGAHLEPDGLISSGSRDTQLTWMDATSRGRPVTPRYGLAVEINALWYDALILLRDLSLIGEAEVPPRIEALILQVPPAFTLKFWVEEGGYLSDTFRDGEKDLKIRPNMLFASSASEGLLDLRQRTAVVRAAGKYLLTPLGLRTLSPDDDDFKADYCGGPDERDSRYHQGTVWPWLIGIMIESSLAVSDTPGKTAERWLDYLDNLLRHHLLRQGWGFVSEVFDGKNPSEGKGCFAQAWSSAEIIRAFSLLYKVIKTERGE